MALNGNVQVTGQELQALALALGAGMSAAAEKTNAGLEKSARILRWGMVWFGLILALIVLVYGIFLQPKASPAAVISAGPPPANTGASGSSTCRYDAVVKDLAERTEFYKKNAEVFKQHEKYCETPPAPAKPAN